jgi:hypothetical protein
MHQISKEQLKEEVLQMVMEGDENLLKVMHLIGSDFKEKRFDESLEKNLLVQRRLARLKGEHQVYKWEDVRESIIVNLRK